VTTLNTRNAIERYLGVEPGMSIKQSATRFQVLAVNFDVTIAAGASDSRSVAVDSGWLFVVDAIVGEIWTPTARTMIAGTPFARAGDPAIAAGTSSQLAHFTLQVRNGEATWFNVPIRCSLLLGNGSWPFFLAQKPVVGGNDRIHVTLANLSPVDGAQAQIAFVGKYVRE